MEQRFAACREYDFLNTYFHELKERDLPKLNKTELFGIQNLKKPRSYLQVEILHQNLKMRINFIKL